MPYIQRCVFLLNFSPLPQGIVQKGIYLSGKSKRDDGKDPTQNTHDGGAGRTWVRILAHSFLVTRGLCHRLPRLALQPRGSWTCLCQNLMEGSLTQSLLALLRRSGAWEIAFQQFPSWCWCCWPTDGTALREPLWQWMCKGAFVHRETVTQWEELRCLVGLESWGPA